jgi:hypothetical protein
MSEAKKRATQEENMSGQQTLNRNVKIVAGASFAMSGLLAPLGNLDAIAAQLSCPIGIVARAALQVLECLAVTAASQALQACLFDHQRLAQVLIQTWISLWLLLVVVGAIVLRASFTRKVEAWPAPSKYFRK